MEYKRMDLNTSGDVKALPAAYSQPNPNQGGAGYGYNQGDFRGYPCNSNNTTIVQQPQQLTVQMAEPLPSAAGSIVLSCIVFWCCCLPLGLASFIVAVVAEGMTNPTEKRSMIRVSYILSIIGIVFCVVCVVIVLALYFAGVIYATEELNNSNEMDHVYESSYDNN